jgi:hypothetical protein
LCQLLCLPCSGVESTPHTPRNHHLDSSPFIQGSEGDLIATTKARSVLTARRSQATTCACSNMSLTQPKMFPSTQSMVEYLLNGPCMDFPIYSRARLLDVLYAPAHRPTRHFRFVSETPTYVFLIEFQHGISKFCGGSRVVPLPPSRHPVSRSDAETGHFSCRI